MVKNHCLAQSIQEAGWYQLRLWLEYFGQKYGAVTIAVDPTYTDKNVRVVVGWSKSCSQLVLMSVPVGVNCNGIMPRRSTSCLKDCLRRGTPEGGCSTTKPLGEIRPLLFSTPLLRCKLNPRTKNPIPRLPLRGSKLIGVRSVNSSCPCHQTQIRPVSLAYG